MDVWWRGLRWWGRWWCSQPDRAALPLRDLQRYAGSRWPRSFVGSVLVLHRRRQGHRRWHMVAQGGLSSRLILSVAIAVLLRCFRIGGAGITRRCPVLVRRRIALHRSPVDRWPPPQLASDVVRARLPCRRNILGASPGVRLPRFGRRDGGPGFEGVIPECASCRRCHGRLRPPGK